MPSNPTDPQVAAIRNLLLLQAGGEDDLEDINPMPDTLLEELRRVYGGDDPAMKVLNKKVPIVLAKATRAAGIIADAARAVLKQSKWVGKMKDDPDNPMNYVTRGAKQVAAQAIQGPKDTLAAATAKLAENLVRTKSTVLVKFQAESGVDPKTGKMQEVPEELKSLRPVMVYAIKQAASWESGEAAVNYLIELDVAILKAAAEGKKVEDIADMMCGVHDNVRGYIRPTPVLRAVPVDSGVPADPEQAEALLKKFRKDTGVGMTEATMWRKAGPAVAEPGTKDLSTEEAEVAFRELTQAPEAGQSSSEEDELIETLGVMNLQVNTLIQLSEQLDAAVNNMINGITEIETLGSKS